VHQVAGNDRVGHAKDGKVVCFFQSAQKFKTRYATFGVAEARCDPKPRQTQFLSVWLRKSPTIEFPDLKRVGWQA